MNEADLSWLCRGDLFVHHSNRMTLTTSAAFCDGRAGRSIAIAKSLVFAARFVLSFHSAKIAAVPGFSEVNP
jgi:hypothetical protein